MSENSETFIGWFLKDLREDYVSKDGGIKKLIPWLLILFTVIGAGICYIVPADIWDNKIEVRSARLAFYAGVVTLNGLLLALSWSSFSKIYDSACASGFCKYLKDKDMLGQYFFFVDFIHYAQIIALIISAMGLVSGLMIASANFPVWLHQAILVATIATFLYALRYAIGSVKLMQGLLLARIDYEEFEKRNSNPNGNVSTLPSKNSS